MNFYNNGNYMVCIMKDGTKIRKTEDEEFIPSFAENVDVKITSKCSIGCQFCYENCHSLGSHGSLFDYPFIESLHPYTEMALNGNDLDHPDLPKFLEFLKNKRVFANMTVHQKQFMDNYNLIKEWTETKLINGLGVSFNHSEDNFIERIKEFPNAVIHVINGIITPSAIDWLSNNDLKLLILGYKELGRGIKFKKDWTSIIASNKAYLYSHLQELKDQFKVLSFDNLALEQLNVKRLLTPEEWEEFYMGDDGKFTFYIDMVEGKFAKNSLSRDRFDIGNLTIDEMFNIIKTHRNG